MSTKYTKGEWTLAPIEPTTCEAVVMDETGNYIAILAVLGNDILKSVMAAYLKAQPEEEESEVDEEVTR